MAHQWFHISRTYICHWSSLNSQHIYDLWPILSVSDVCSFLFKESQDRVPLKQKLQSRPWRNPWVNLAPDIKTKKGNPRDTVVKISYKGKPWAQKYFQLYSVQCPHLSEIILLDPTLMSHPLDLVSSSQHMPQRQSSINSKYKLISHLRNSNILNEENTDTGKFRRMNSSLFHKNCITYQINYAYFKNTVTYTMSLLNNWSHSSNNWSALVFPSLYFSALAWPNNVSFSHLYSCLAFFYGK